MKKGRLIKQKEYKRYIKVEKEANNDWLKYVDKECCSQILGYADVNSPAFNFAMDNCILEKYKARINDSFLEGK